jgi:tetratricopeptide (TPR) repeat protein
LIAAMGLAALLFGCRASRPTAGETYTGPARIQEATRLAAEAQKAQNAGQTERAIELYRQSISVSGDLAAAWNNLGVLLMGRNENMDAVAAFKRAAELSPTDPRPMENIGLVYSSLGWEQKALEYYLAALDRDPRSRQALRGAVSSSKLLALADEAALTRARTAMMVDTDPDWRHIYEMEQTRIDGQLRLARKGR